MAQNDRYTTAAIVLHWLIAAAILAQIALGLWMIGIPKEPVGVRAGWFNLHKSTGMTLALLVLLRLIWRLTHRPPPLPMTLPGWQRRAAGASHFLLYACMLAMPLSGFFGSVASGFPIKYFGITVPITAKDPALKDFLSIVHLSTGCLFGALITLHVAAALKHRWLDRDSVFERMWPLRRPSSAAPLQGR